MLVTQLVQVIFITVGSTILGTQFGWQTGVGISLIGYALMPYQPR
jgi:hypothetical protein